MGRASEETPRGSLGSAPRFCSPSCLVQAAPAVPSFVGYTTPFTHALPPRLVCHAAEPSKELLAHDIELLLHSAPDLRPTHKQLNCLLPTLLLASLTLSLAPGAMAAARLPDGCVHPGRADEEIYDDVEPVGPPRTGRGFQLPSVFRPSASPHPSAGGYRRRWGAAGRSTAAQRAPASQGQQQSSP